MIKTRNLFLKVLPAFCLILCFPLAAVGADTFRKPVYAGSFYPDRPAELNAMIEQLSSQVKPPKAHLPPGTSLKALIMPHAGYIYSGLTAAYAARMLTEHPFNKIILLGPDHHIGFRCGSISDVTAYITPLGAVPLHQDAARLRRDGSVFQTIPDSDRQEHSLEVILPFLQYYSKRFELIPIVTGRDSNYIARYAEFLTPLLDQNTLVVASSDLSHYLSYAEAVARDRETIQMILQLEADKLLTRDNSACGKIPILTVIEMARRQGWQPVLLHYSNSGDTAGSRSRVVGYAAIAFYGGPPMQSLSNHQGQALVRLARQTIMEKLGFTTADVVADAFTDSVFQTRRGTFVTLTIEGRLRGCIGNLDATHSILTGVKNNAVNAAFNDPRFSPLSAAELKDVDIEISILTEPQPLEYHGKRELMAKLRPHVDGVILRKGSSSATFLPQVWEQLPKPERFLSHLCQKAGLNADTWEKTQLEILTYQVQYFEEEK